MTTSPPGRTMPRTRHPLTEQQRTMLAFIGGRTDSYYLLAEAFRLTGPLDGDRLRTALRVVLARHDVLRSTFPADGDECELIDPGSELLDTVLEEADGFDSATTAARVGFDRVTRPLALDREPPLRLWLGRVSATESVLVLAGHHLVLDRWALRLLHRELALGCADPDRLSEADAPPQYWAADGGRDVPHPRHDALFGRGYRAVRALHDAARSPRGPAATYREQLGADLARLLPAAAARLAVTPYVIGAAAVLGALADVLGDPEVIVGTSSGGRTDSRSLRAMGYFSTSVFLGARLSGPPDLALVRSLDRQLTGWRLAPRRQWESLLAEVGAEDLFPVKFGLEAADAAGPGPQFDGLTVERLERPDPDGDTPSTARRPLDIDVEYDRYGVLLSVVHRTDAVDPSLPSALVGRFAHHVRRLSARPEDL